MTFKTIKELEDYVMKQAKQSLFRMQWEVDGIIRDFLFEYYSEFKPDFYERTYQLLNSLVRTDLKKYGNGYIAEVYFDLTQLDYSMKKFERWVNEDGLYYNPFNPSHTSGDYWFKNKNHSEEKTLRSAMIGGMPHGGKADGTAIWIESLRKIHKNFVPLFKNHLKQNGIPIK